MKVKSESEVAQSCLTLCDPMDCSLPGSSIHGILQARVLQWGATAFSGVFCYLQPKVPKLKCLGSSQYINVAVKPNKSQCPYYSTVLPGFLLNWLNQNLNQLFFFFLCLSAGLASLLAIARHDSDSHEMLLPNHRQSHPPRRRFTLSEAERRLFISINSYDSKSRPLFTESQLIQEIQTSAFYLQTYQPDIIPDARHHQKFILANEVQEVLGKCKTLIPTKYLPF